MIAVDTSVVVAAFASWHEGHASAAAIVAKQPRIPGHVLVESYSVLTRLPPPHRAPAALVQEFLALAFPAVPLVLPAAEYLAFLEEATGAGLDGGSVYDALVGVCARRAGATLVSRDRRAASTYERLGVDYELLQ